MWRDGQSFITAGQSPMRVLSETSRRSLDGLIDQSAPVLATVETVDSSFISRHQNIRFDPAVEETFRNVAAPTPLLDARLVSVEDLRDRLELIDHRWLLDAVHAVRRYVEDEETSRVLGRHWRAMDLATPGIEVEIRSIEQAWKTSGFDDFWLRLWTQDTALEVVSAAIAEADRAAQRDELDTCSMDLAPCPGGYAVQIGPAFEAEAICNWIRLLTGALEREGVTGRLGGAIQAWLPTELQTGPPELTLWVQFRLPPASAREARWKQEPALTRDLVPTTLDWVQADPGTTILMQNGCSLLAADVDLYPELERALLLAGMAAVEVFEESAGRVRHANFGGNGTAVFQVKGKPRAESLAELRDLASRLPLPVDHAFIRVAQSGASYVSAIDSVQKLPGMKEHHVRYAQHLLDRYLPDAHGFQIVTDAHLAAAHNLRDWTISDLGHGNHLVEAPDPQPWYAYALPDPDALARGRADWGAALLTAEIANAGRSLA